MNHNEIEKFFNDTRFTLLCKLTCGHCLSTFDYADRVDMAELVDNAAIELRDIESARTKWLLTLDV